jgi:hypothetical protein
MRLTLPSRCGRSSGGSVKNRQSDRQRRQATPCWPVRARRTGPRTSQKDPTGFVLPGPTPTACLALSSAATFVRELRHSPNVTVADITTTSYRIGRVRIDPTRVRGDGGAINPALVLSVSAELEPQPAERQLALTELRVELSIAGGPASAEARLGEPVRVRHVGGPQGIWATNPAATRDYDAEVRFPLNSAHLWLLESGAARQDRAIHLFVRVEAEAALVREEHQNVLGVSSGSAVELVPLTWIRVGDVTVPVPRSGRADPPRRWPGHHTTRCLSAPAVRWVAWQRPHDVVRSGKVEV